MDLLTHKRARFDYEILETFEAGIELLGTEVKSVRKKYGSLDGARVVVRGGEAYLLGAHIPPFQVKNVSGSYDPNRTRRLLLTKKQIHEIGNRGEGKGLTIIPVSLYNKGRLLKVSVALVRGKKKFDKRESIKKRDTDRDIKRELKRL
jgi:SsrA-binding protein